MQLVGNINKERSKSSLKSLGGKRGKS